MAIVADATFAVAKRKLSYRNCKSCVYKCDDLLSYIENNTWVARRYGIYLLVFTFDISLVRCAHSFDIDVNTRR